LLGCGYQKNNKQKRVMRKTQEKAKKQTIIARKLMVLSSHKKRHIKFNETKKERALSQKQTKKNGNKKTQHTLQQICRSTTVDDGSNNVSRWMTWLPISLKNAAKCDKWYQLQNHSLPNL
jgi:hypothetical protein